MSQNLSAQAASRLSDSSILASAALQRVSSLENVRRPIVAMAVNFPCAASGAEHAHRRAQFLHSCSGVMTVTTERGSWIVPPQYALWIPPGTRHRTRYCGAVQLRTLYFEPRVVDDMPSTCRLIEVSPLLSALVREAVALPPEYDLVGRERMIMDLIPHEIARMPNSPLHAPLPKDRRLVRICNEILGDPGREGDVLHWASVGNLSRRTMARLFLRETGMSFTAWRQRVRLLEAMVRMAAGQPITTVAFDLGYESSSAFTAMFRRNLGFPPTEYLRSLGSQHSTTERPDADMVRPNG